MQYAVHINSTHCYACVFYRQRAVSLVRTFWPSRAGHINKQGSLGQAMTSRLSLSRDVCCMALGCMRYGLHLACASRASQSTARLSMVLFFLASFLFLRLSFSPSLLLISFPSFFRDETLLSKISLNQP